MDHFEDYRTDRSDLDQFVNHILTIEKRESGETVFQMETKAALPVPRCGEWIMIIEETLTRVDGEVATKNKTIDPASSDVLYQVDRVATQYIHRTPDESTETQFESGVTLSTWIEVVQEET